jgi:uncharacterized protein YjaG (DUF416 family)
MPRKRINLDLDEELRERHQQACLQARLTQSERLRRLLKADVKYFDRYGSLPDIDFVETLADLLPQRFGELRAIEKATGLDPHRLLAIAQRETSSSELTEDELSTLADLLDVEIEYLKQLVDD